MGGEGGGRGTIDCTLKTSARHKGKQKMPAKENSNMGVNLLSGEAPAYFERKGKERTHGKIYMQARQLTAIPFRYKIPEKANEARSKTQGLS